jgi:hypothetical protein
MYIIKQREMQMTYYLTARNAYEAQLLGARKYNAGEPTQRFPITTPNTWVVTFDGRGLPNVAQMKDLVEA